MSIVSSAEGEALVALERELKRVVLELYRARRKEAAAAPGTTEALVLAVERSLLELREAELAAKYAAAATRFYLKYAEQRLEEFRSQPNRSARETEEFFTRLKEDLARRQKLVDDMVAAARDVERVRQERREKLEERLEQRQGQGYGYSM